MGILNIEDNCVRKGSRVLIGLVGESGSGKTYSALLIGRGLVGPKGKLGLLDTETGRGRHFANDPDIGGYAYAELTPQFTPERYVEAIDEFAAAGIEALVIDSTSHEWEGIGGVLEMADATGSSGLLKWKEPKLRHNRFKQALLRSRMHLLLCFRAKEKLVQKGKEIVSEGIVAIQDKRLIFEMTAQCMMESTPGRAGFYTPGKTIPKDLVAAFPEGRRLGVQTGQLIAEWVAGGVPVDHSSEALKKAGEDAAEAGTERLRDWFKKLGKADQLKIKPYLDGNLKSIAETADAEARAQADDTPKPAFGSIRPAFLDGAIQQARAADGPTHLAEIQDETLKELVAAKSSADVIEEWNSVCKAVFEARFAAAA